MNLFKIKPITAIPVLFLLLFSAAAAAEAQEDKRPQNRASGIGMAHMSNSDIINSEKEFLREMIQHHTEAINTSILLFACTKDPELKKITELIYTARNKDMLEMRIYYARLYDLIPKDAAYLPMMSDLNAVEGHERDIQYMLHMTVHHKSAVDMARKVFAIHGIRVETFKFAKHIIKTQSAEIKLLEKWLMHAGALKY